ncbi:MAG: toxin [Bacteroidales bacterium]|jgi:hypothetical protein|nr:toxin [Bacteroidales bacterium]
MGSVDEVRLFLEQLNTKFILLGDPVSFENREKNHEALAELDIRPTDREKYIRNLKVEDYYSGPNPDDCNPDGPPYFEFGLNIKGNEVYIKLTLGYPNKRINCISFHIAERPITYPFKK